MAKKRKWSNLKGVVPNEPQETSSERFGRVLKEKDNRKTRTLLQLAEERDHLKSLQTIAKDTEKERNILFDAIEMRVLEELEKVKATAGTDMWRGPQNQTFSPKYTPYAYVTDKEKLRQWVKDQQLEHLLELPSNVLGNLVKEALNPDLAAMVPPNLRSQLKPGMAGSMQPPPGVGVYLRTTVHATSGSKTEEDEGDD